MFTKPERHVDTVFIHCTASDNEQLHGKWLVDWLKDIHVNQNKWSDIGYHFVIDKFGELLVCRNIERTPAAQAGFNTGSIAICCHGLDIDKFTQAQFDKLHAVCHEINAAYTGNIRFRGHCEVSNKTCPVLDYAQILELDSQGHMKF